MRSHTPEIAAGCIDLPMIERLSVVPSTHPPRILLLYGSLRERLHSRRLVAAAGRLHQGAGAETRIFNPAGLWSNAQVWSRPCSNCDRVVDLMENLVKFAQPTRDISGELTTCDSQRTADAPKLAARVTLGSN